MTDNPAMKRALIMQSFAPLFLILLIKYFDFKLFHLCKKFSDIVLNNPIYALTKVVNHSAFIMRGSTFLQKRSSSSLRKRFLRKNSVQNIPRNWIPMQNL